MFSSGTFAHNRRRGDSLLTQVLLLIMVFGGCALAVGMYVHLSSQQSIASTGKTIAPAAESESVEVLVPIDNIETGTALEPTMFKRERRPAVAVSTETVRDLEEIKGLFAKGLLVSSQPFIRDYLTTLQPVNRLTASIPIGYRAISIPVDATSSVEGWAQPGARVDLLWISSFTGKQTISFIAENAKVLSANRQTEGGPKSNDPRDKKKEKAQAGGGVPRTVTLLLTNRDSLKVRLAALTGRVALILRGSGDLGRTAPTADTITYTDLFDTGPKEETQIPRNIVSVKVREKGSSSSKTILFENGQKLDE